MAKLEKVTSKEDLLVLNNVIDKYVPESERSLTPEEIWGEEWTNKTKRLGHMIAGLRFRENMSQIQLAKALKGVKQSNISAWETGKEKVPKKRIKQMSELFGTDLDGLVKS